MRSRMVSWSLKSGLLFWINICDLSEQAQVECHCVREYCVWLTEKPWNPAWRVRLGFWRSPNGNLHMRDGELVTQAPSWSMVVHPWFCVDRSISGEQVHDANDERFRAGRFGWHLGVGFWIDEKFAWFWWSEQSAPSTQHDWVCRDDYVYAA